MKFILEGEPIAQSRHKDKMRKGKIWRYDELAGHKQIERLRLAKFAVNDPYIAYKDYYHVNLTFYFEIPRSDSKKIRALKLANIITHNVKPDFDNCEKFIVDCMTGVFFSDDKKIVKSQSEKRWSEKGYVEIEIYGFNHEIKK